VPTYQYACTACTHTFEQFQNFSDDALTVCPQCQGRLRKVFNAVGVVFKGSGFYRTDSRKAEDKPAAAAKNGGADGGKDAGSPAGGSGESRSATPSEKVGATKDSKVASTTGAAGSTTAA
jgi:putative FmdB family regulatory protein